MKINEVIKSLLPEIIEIRRELHKYPELSGEEYETSKKICSVLDKYEIEYKSNIGGYGVVAIIKGKSIGKTIAIRADMDALPVIEENELDYCSLNKGVMHACGHDTHTSIMLGAAIALKKFENEFNGNVKFIFQPAEENCTGAKLMIKEGSLKSPDVDAIIGLHVMPNVPTGKIELRYGKLNAATTTVDIKIHGKQGHAAYPDTAIDAIVMASHVVVALQTTVSRSASPLNPIVLTFGTIKGGERPNIISKDAQIVGTLRTLDSESRRKAKETIKRIAENTAIALGGTATVIFDDACLELINNDKVSKIVENTAIETVGIENVIHKEFPSMGSEDFSYFSDTIPATFFHLGIANQTKGSVFPLHSENFRVDEDCIEIGINMEVNSVLNLLK